MTSSHGNIFRVIGHLCGEFTGEFPAQRPVTRSLDVFFDLRLNKRLRKQTWGWWFETPSRPLWRQCNDHLVLLICSPGQSCNNIIMIRIEPIAFVYKSTDLKSLSRHHLFKFIWAPQTPLIIVFFNKFLVNIRSALLKILAWYLPSCSIWSSGHSVSYFMANFSRWSRVDNYKVRCDINRPYIWGTKTERGI